MFPFRNLLQFLLMCCVFSGPALAASQTPYTLELGVTHTLDSRHQAEQRRVHVYLPEGYADSGTTYPVLYLLDGERHFVHSIMASRLLAEQQRTPQMVIVAITNNDDTRSRDLYFERDKFTAFIQEELMPHIQSRYRVSGENVLYGHSLAGQFAMHLLANEPELFDRFIVASPPLKGIVDDVYNKLLQQGKQAAATSKVLYMSLANQEQEDANAFDGVHALVTQLEKEAIGHLRWHYEYLDKESHITGYYPSLFNGLTAVFADEKISH
ncbi:alpha/beta hydrolase-fold protein [Aliiglaciecola sp. CAU 1673]|uniref:alpha/beta hydrolase n=1 Tax=Aliiglaciecola sp. CAU 1673 TaxID=3032595 RepID=UPI0023DCC27A|nr:alpha/beta hydrolase-fold protein [Aliiglaciecola sp. CAU 1673]MDF2179808.1 alpha/beta hydrolase-fold protein [Aliiglaciecola sp. CAU 1673]